ncbi:NAD(P)H-hydrate dehydratase [Roseovarius sp. 2305UL8-3]|uniref:NAD(P)H-hydrate dehydratase n=1 Tax=Roseovarius conchicola TaxID=3121636 RepID=UPI0035289181
MTELLTATQMRAIETAAIESGEVTGLELMERAGRGVVEAVFEEWPELAKTSHRAVVLCGPGNNGGDGFVVARLLKEWGWEVEVFLYGDPAKLPSDAKVNYERWRELGEISEHFGLSVEKQIGLIEAFIHEENPILFVEALLGTGLSRPIEKFMTDFDMVLLNGASHDPIKRVSIDIPAGLCADSGRVLGRAFHAELTVSFHERKLGHLLDEGPDHCGSLKNKSIALTDDFMRDFNFDIAHKVDVGPNTEGSSTYSQFSKGFSWEHKYDHGHAVVVSGGPGKTGATRLAARGALRIGAGLVTLGVPPNAQMEVASQITALMLSQIEDGDGLARILEDDRLNAVCLGPGLGLERARELVPIACGGVKPRPTVLDADALTTFADAPEVLFGMLHDKCVLTPHAGEFARLFPDIAEKLNETPTKGPAYSKVDATREAAKRAGCVVLFKGPDTVIAAPDGRCSINSAHYDRAAPWLATAGSGDVLAGFITGLLARGFQPMQAAETAAWLHIECARSFGPGLIAEDLPEELPKVFRELGL